MKSTILTVFIAAIFAACNTSQPADQASTSQTIMVADTNGLSQFKQWKENQEKLNAQAIIDEDKSFTTDPLEEQVEEVSTRVAEPKTRIIYRTVPAKERSVAKVTKPAPRSHNETGVRTSRSRTSVPNTTETNTSENESTASNTGVGTGTDGSYGDVVGTVPAPVEKKNEGWSKAAKGTAIGAGSGAVLGAILSKNKGKGAVIGGIVGAAGGYVLGRTQDKKDGRY